MQLSPSAGLLEGFLQSSVSILWHSINTWRFIDRSPPVRTRQVDRDTAWHWVCEWAGLICPEVQSKQHRASEWLKDCLQVCPSPRGDSTSPLEGGGNKEEIFGNIVVIKPFAHKQQWDSTPRGHKFSPVQTCFYTTQCLQCKTPTSHRWVAVVFTLRTNKAIWFEADVSSSYGGGWNQTHGLCF